MGELAMLLSEIGNSFEPSDSVLIQLEAEQGKPPFKSERETGSDEPIGRLRDTPGSVELNGNKEQATSRANGSAMSDVATSPDTAVTCNKEGTPQTRGHSTANCDPDIAQETEEKKEENVWSALRKIKEAKPTPAPVSSQDESETLTLDQFDNLIKNLSANLKKEVIKPEKLESVTEKDEEETKLTEEQSHQMIFNGNGSVDEGADVKEFVYDEWKAEMENLFGKTEQYVAPTEKSASDEAYLENLRRKIAATVKKQSKDFNQSEKQKVLENKEKVANTPAANVNTPPTNVNDFGLLKLKEKERKKRKKEAAFQSHVVESTDKLKEMSIKTAKIEKLSTETESELLKLREKAVLLAQKSAAKENEFEAIFKDIDNIDAMVFESDKKKKKSSKVKEKEEIIAAIAEKNELHWTEEDRGKWESCSSKKNHSKVSEVLSTMKAMACQGNSEVINSLKITISHCQKVEEESKAEMMRVKEEKKKQAEEVKLQKDLENRAIQRKTQEQNGISCSQDAACDGKTGGSLAKKEQAQRITAADSKRLAGEEEARKKRDVEEKTREGKKETKNTEVISSTSLTAEELERLAEEEEEREILELERKVEQRRKEEEQLQADFLKQQKEQEMIKEKEMKQRAEQEENEKRKKIEEDQKKNEAKKRAEEKQKKQKEEEEKKKKAEEEKKKRAEEEKKKRVEEEKRKKAEEETKKRAEEEKKKKTEEEAKKREDEEKKKRAEEDKKKRAEEERKKREAEEQEKTRLEEEKIKKAAEEKKKLEEEEKKKKAKEEKEKKKKEDEKKKAEEERRKKAEEETKKRAEEEKKKKTE